MDKEPLMGGFVYATILSQPSFERALGFRRLGEMARAATFSRGTVERFNRGRSERDERGEKIGGSTRGPGTGSIGKPLGLI